MRPSHAVSFLSPSLFTNSARAILAIAVSLGLAACAPSALSSARTQISSGNYPAARQELVALSARTDLNENERREVMDDLCLCDFMIGRPTYSLSEQRGACVEAMKMPGSQSESIVAQIDNAQRFRDEQEVKTALAEHDLADAERAAIDYQRLPGADSVIVARWSKEIWTLADQQVFADSVAKKHSLGAAVSAARKNHPDVAKMSKPQFVHWVEKTMTVSGTPLADSVRVGDKTLTLSVSEANFHVAALSLDRLATINDAMVARCACDARTNVAVAETGFPAYFIRLDPETKMSEVMILPRGDTPILSAASK